MDHFKRGDGMATPKTKTKDGDTTDKHRPFQSPYLQLPRSLHGLDSPEKKAARVLTYQS
jgi:hypothetical protein